MNIIEAMQSIKNTEANFVEFFSGEMYSHLYDFYEDAVVCDSAAGKLFNDERKRTIEILQLVEPQKLCNKKVNAIILLAYAFKSCNAAVHAGTILLYDAKYAKYTVRDLFAATVQTLHLARIAASDSLLQI